MIYKTTHVLHILAQNNCQLIMKVEKYTYFMYFEYFWATLRVMELLLVESCDDDIQKHDL